VGNVGVGGLEFRMGFLEVKKLKGVRRRRRLSFGNEVLVGSWGFRGVIRDE
jgi:hypothetical protein